MQNASHLVNIYQVPEDPGGKHKILGSRLLPTGDPNLAVNLLVAKLATWLLPEHGQAIALAYSVNEDGVYLSDIGFEFNVDLETLAVSFAQFIPVATEVIFATPAAVYQEVL